MHKNSGKIISIVIVILLIFLTLNNFTFFRVSEAQQNNSVNGKLYINDIGNISCLKTNEIIDFILPYEIFDKSQEQIKYRKNLKQLVEIGCTKDERPNIARGQIRIENVSLIYTMKISDISKKIELYENISKYKILNKFAKERILYLNRIKQIYSGIIIINQPIGNNPELQGQEFAKAYLALEELRQ